METEVGLRVVRGPDWEWGDQDRGEGHVGTVVEVPGRAASQDDHGCSDRRFVVVQWDHGKRFKYRCGPGVEGKYDLRVLDNAPVGTIHSGVLCDSCGREDVLSGMRWKCAYCFDYDLCSSCYMARKHNLEHKFTRFDKKWALMHYTPSRSGSRQVEAKGIFKGAEVNRDLDWEYGDDDGGPGGVGKVLSCKQWHSDESYRSAVDVQWKQTQKCTLCRVGHKGKVDIKCITPASGGLYYPDHLPVLGASYEAPGPREFASGDYVKVELDEEAFSAAMQSGNMDIIMIIGEVGVIESISDGRKVTVKFGEDQKKTVDVSVLIKAGILRLWPTQVVRVIDDMAEVMKLQVGRGEWRDDMENILGKTGVVLGQTNRGDVAVRFEGRETDYTLNPHCLILTNDQSTTLKPGVGFQRSDVALQAEVRSLFEQDSSYVLFQAARLGDGTIITEFLSKFRNEIDKKFENGQTALHQAALQGYVSIVKILLEFGADKNLSDIDGRTPLHFCALRSNADVATVLLQDGANPNLADLEGRTPLIIAASKGKTSTVQVLVDEQKTDLNIQDKDKNTALHHAVLASWHWSVRLLLLAKADPTKLNSKDQAPLHIACGKGFTAGVEEILKHYPDQVNLKNRSHKTPLYFAALNGHADIVTYLLSQQDCDVNIKSLEGHTPLHAAVVSGVPKSVEKLIGHGADVNAKDNKGNTPLHLLQIMKNREEIQEADDLPELMKVKQMLNCYENVTSQTILACFLVYKGADVYTENGSGTTALQELPIDISAVVATFNENNLKAGTQDYASDPSPGSTSTKLCMLPPKTASGETSKCPKNQPSLCMLCEEPVTVKLLPCGHTEICSLCAKRATKCPLCKNRILEVKSLD